ncbi:hypothetical protein [Embleya sp. NBC_00888]|uniref:hypothetical protein n=1 Tax=Embleya sp. NBC_00888 TaxID=2975960 RepID=UPI002F918A35
MQENRSFDHCFGTTRCVRGHGTRGRTSGRTAGRCGISRRRGCTPHGTTAGACRTMPSTCRRSRWMRCTPASSSPRPVTAGAVGNCRGTRADTTGG